jgi:ELWxxDGT repeat protein
MPRHAPFSMVLLLIFAFSGAIGQTAVMVKDFDPDRLTPSSFSWFTNFNGTLFFGVYDGTANGIWKSDGTEAGTVKVKTLGNPGDPADLKEFVTVGATMFFQANDGTNGYELWKTDGTDAGTVMVKDIYSGPTSSIIKIEKAYNGNVYFNASGGAAVGYELWKSDGTDAGTVMVKDIYPGPSHGNPTSFAISNGTLFFTAITAANGRELWKTDGTETGTVLVKDINTGPTNSGNSLIGNLIDVNGTLFFTVAYSVVGGTTYTGYQLWKSDGTDTGTVMVKGPIYLSPPAPYGLTNVNGTLFYSALTGANGTELWKSDGTTDGTVLVADNLAAASSPQFLCNVNGTLFFQRYVDASVGYELWKSDGTDSGTVMVKEIYPGPGSGGPMYMANVNGTCYFWANDGTNGTEIWRSDGTDAGTVMVVDVYPGPGGSVGVAFPIVNGTLYYPGFGVTYGTALWKIDAGTTGVDDPRSSGPSGFTLDRNYPNPFNPSTNISFTVPVTSHVSLKVFDALGREVATLVSGEMTAGSYTRQWQAAGFPSGVYFYSLQANAIRAGEASPFTGTRKLLLLR